MVAWPNRGSSLRAHWESGMQSGRVARLWVPRRGQKHGPRVKGASYAVGPTPSLQGDLAPLLAALEHLDNLGTLKTQGHLAASLRCLIQVLLSHQCRTREQHVQRGVVKASPPQCSHRPHQHPWNHIPGSPLLQLALQLGSVGVLFLWWGPFTTLCLFLPVALQTSERSQAAFSLPLPGNQLESPRL